MSKLIAPKFERRWCGWFSVIVVCLVPVSVMGQDGEDVAEWVDADTAALVNIPDFPEAYDRIRSAALFQNPRLQKAMEILSDERFPIISAEDRESLLGKVGEVESLVRSINQVSLVVHKYDDRSFVWSLFIGADEDTRQELREKLLGLDRMVKRSVRLTEERDPGSLETPAPSIQPASQASGKVSELGWCRTRQFGDWLVLSNHGEFIDQLETWNSDPKFRSLAKSRKYQAIRAQSSGFSKNVKRIFVYGNPVKLAKFIPNSSPDRWEMFKVNELPSCGLNILLNDVDKADDSTPLIIVEAIVKFTEPTVGIAKMFAQYRPVRIPPLAVEPIEFQAFSRDEESYTQASIEAYEEKFGAGAADSTLQQRLEHTGLSLYDDVVHRRSGFATVRYLNDAGQQEVMVIESIGDLEAATRFADGLVDAATRNRDKVLHRSEVDGSLWWIRPGKEQKEHSGISGLRRSRELSVDLVNVEHDAYVLTDHWWCQGDLPALREQVQLLQTRGGSEHSDRLQQLVDHLRRITRTTEAPVVINYFTTDSWQETIDRRELQYARDNAVPQKFVLSFKDLESGGVIDFSDFENAAKGVHRIGIEIADPENEEAEVPGRQTLEVMMPLTLAKRNADGHRINLTQRRDVAKAVEVMLLKCISEAYPRTLVIYTHGDGHVRVVAGVFANAKPDSESR